MRIVVDGMGGDNAPKAIVGGVVEAINEFNVEIAITGDKELLEQEFADYEFDRSKLEIIHTTEVIENEDKPVQAIRRKKDSSMVVALNLVKENKADAIVSAGSTGALLTGATLIVGRIKGIDRPCLCPCMPNIKGGMTIIADSGANADCKPRNLSEFAMMSNIYLKKVLGMENPRIGLGNIGSEEGKGNELVKSAYNELKTMDLNFVGNIEGRDVIESKADVIVCDGFTGNIMLKTCEGVAMGMMKLIKETLMSSFKGKLGALLIKEDMRKLKAFLDYSEYGGAPFLGVKGGVIKAHGSSNSKAIKNAIKQAINFTEGNVVEDIETYILSKKEDEKKQENKTEDK
ncbi:phosphate acyltransferase PlsX [Terrisporobacter mayombei]|nr:phosphate acyltransferase PlsX [Terrisporobacter mayombei]